MRRTASQRRVAQSCHSMSMTRFMHQKVKTDDAEKCLEHGRQRYRCIIPLHQSLSHRCVYPSRIFDDIASLMSLLHDDRYSNCSFPSCPSSLISTDTLVVDMASAADPEAVSKALQEKEQGNAAYKSRDFGKAISHYTAAWELHKDITYLNNLAGKHSIYLYC